MKNYHPACCFSRLHTRFKAMAKYNEVTYVHCSNSALLVSGIGDSELESEECMLASNRSNLGKVLLSGRLVFLSSTIHFDKKRKIMLLQFTALSFNIYLLSPAMMIRLAYSCSPSPSWWICIPGDFGGSARERISSDKGCGRKIHA